MSMIENGNGNGPVNGKAVIDNIHFAKWVGQYIKLRDMLEDFDAAMVKRRNEEFVFKMNKLQGRMLTALDATGLKSAKTENGTASVLTKSTAACSDPDAFITFVRENDAYELMDRRANATACRAFAEETGALPPGVEINTTRSVGVRKPT
jgi:hypothetical protein